MFLRNDLNNENTAFNLYFAKRKWHWEMHNHNYSVFRWNADVNNTVVALLVNLENGNSPCHAVTVSLDGARCLGLFESDELPVMARLHGAQAYAF